MRLPNSPGRASYHARAPRLQRFPSRSKKRFRKMKMVTVVIKNTGKTKKGTIETVVWEGERSYYRWDPSLFSEQNVYINFHVEMLSLHSNFFLSVLFYLDATWSTRLVPGEFSEKQSKSTNRHIASPAGNFALSCFFIFYYDSFIIGSTKNEKMYQDWSRLKQDACKRTERIS